MKLYHIVAFAEGGVIGKDNKLPWHFPVDLKHFKTLTVGRTVIMGRRTFEGIGRKPLPGRENFVLTRSRTEKIEGVKFFNSVEEALKAVRTEAAFVIGGASLFRETLDRVDGIYLTLVQGKFEGDTYYPVASVEALERHGFRVVSREKPAEEPRIEFIELKK